MGPREHTLKIPLTLDTVQFRQQYLWQNLLFKIENKPIYLRNEFKKGIEQVKHIMKNAWIQFLSHSEQQNRYDFQVCPLFYCRIISALKNLMKNNTLTSVTTETIKLPTKVFQQKFANQKNLTKLHTKQSQTRKREFLSIAKQND